MNDMNANTKYNFFTFSFWVDQNYWLPWIHILKCILIHITRYFCTRASAMAKEDTRSILWKNSPPLWRALCIVPFNWSGTSNIPAIFLTTADALRDVIVSWFFLCWHLRMHTSVLYAKMIQWQGTPASFAISIQYFLCSGLKLHLSMMGILPRRKILRVRPSQFWRLPKESWFTRSYFEGASCGDIGTYIHD